MNTPGFRLIETMLLENGAFFLLNEHLSRLEKSARYFSFDLDLDKARGSLNSLARTLDISMSHKVRLLLSPSGATDISAEPLPENPPGEVSVTISRERTDRNDISYYHKTTNRQLYTAELEKCRQDGFYEVLFMNDKDEITEGAFTNLLIQKGSKYFTPPVSCGLLNGVFRQHLIDEGKLGIKEKVLREKDLGSCDNIYIMNSVRKLVPAILR